MLSQYAVDLQQLMWPKRAMTLRWRCHRRRAVALCRLSARRFVAKAVLLIELCDNLVGEAHKIHKEDNEDQKDVVHQTHVSPNSGKYTRK